MERSPRYEAQSARIMLQQDKKEPSLSRLSEHFPASPGDRRCRYPCRVCGSRLGFLGQLIPERKLLDINLPTVIRLRLTSTNSSLGVTLFQPRRDHHTVFSSSTSTCTVMSPIYACLLGLEARPMLILHNCYHVASTITVRHAIDKHTSSSIPASTTCCQHDR